MAPARAGGELILYGLGASGRIVHVVTRTTGHVERDTRYLAKCGVWVDGASLAAPYPKGKLCDKCLGRLHQERPKGEARAPRTSKSSP